MHRRFSQCLKLCRLKAAWESALLLRNNENWRQLGVAALEMLDVEMAIAGEMDESFHELSCPLMCI